MTSSITSYSWRVLTFPTPALFMDSTAAEGRARGYLMVDLPRDGGDDFLSRLIDESVEDKSSWDALSLIAKS